MKKKSQSSISPGNDFNPALAERCVLGNIGRNPVSHLAMILTANNKVFASGPVLVAIQYLTWQ